MKIWLEKSFKRNPKIYFVVGYCTLLEAKLLQKEQHNAEISDRARTPIGATVDLTPTGELDLEAGGGQEKTTSGEVEFEVAEECIFTICYRRVGFKFHKGVDSASLLATTGIRFRRAGRKVQRRKLLKWVLRARTMEKGDFAHMSRLPRKRVRRSLLT